MNTEEMIVIVDLLIHPNHLTVVQEMVLKHSWSGMSYQEIAALSGYDPDYIRLVGCRLWQKLSDATNKKVTKSNIRAILRQLPHHNYALPRENDHSPPEIISQTLTNSVVDLELPGTPLRINSPLYIERLSIEKKCLWELQKSGSLIRIRAPRLWGKTSLILRTLANINSNYYQVVKINCQQADQAILENSDRFFRWFCAKLSHQLGRELLLNKYWNVDLGSKESCHNYLENYILANSTQPLIMAIDNIQYLFNYPIVAQDFLSLLRIWYEESINSPLWQKLRVMITQDTQTYLPKDLDQSLFDFGFCVDLPPFTPEQIYQLATYLVKEKVDDYFIDLLYQLVGGHPYLTHLACHYFHSLNLNMVVMIDQLKNHPELIYGEHLRKLQTTLKQNPLLLKTFQNIKINSVSELIEPTIIYQLESLGLVKINDDRLFPSCSLYHHYL